MNPFNPVGGNAKLPITPMKALRILLIEGDALIGALLTEILDGMGHRICAIEARPAKALEAAREWRPDLVFIDVGTNDPAGLAAVADILHTDFVPHVLVAGDVLNALAFGGKAVLIRKPFRERDIAEAMRAVLRPGGAASPRPQDLDARPRPLFNGRTGAGP